MARDIGVCGLCRRKSQLNVSHLLPAGAYKLVREKLQNSPPDPIVVLPGKALNWSRQITSVFLCSQCEGRFNKYGENFVVSQLAQPFGDFKLRKTLEGFTPFFNDERFSAYDAHSLPSKEIDQFLYFAASVFWRSSAGSWKIGSNNVSRISLGLRYEEEFRKYLLGQSGFPTNARVRMHVSTEIATDLMVLSVPSTGMVGRMRCYKFYVPGVMFILMVGQDVPKQFDEGALNGDRHPAIILCSWCADSFFAEAVRLVKQTPPSRNLQWRETLATERHGLPPF